MATGFLYDDQFLKHDAGRGHPESPQRLARTLAHLKEQAWFGTLSQVRPAPAEEKWILTTHAAPYLKRSKEACEEGAPWLDTPDVGISSESYATALLAAGGGLMLADRMMAGEIQNGFALLRPPGHHAELSHAMGFCLFNNVAILARYLQQKHGLDKILILDWDVHHGNGTQHTFEEDPSVLYASLHQYPFYPGTGSAWETGEGRGRGATLNCPMPAGASDREYETAFCEQILPKIEGFKPEAVLVSAGFDAHESDPLASINLSTEFFGWMTERMMEAADKHADGRLLSLLEGGYNLDYLPRCVALHVETLMKKDKPPLARPASFR